MLHTERRRETWINILFDMFLWHCMRFDARSLTFSNFISGQSHSVHLVFLMVHVNLPSHFVEQSQLYHKSGIRSNEYALCFHPKHGEAFSGSTSNYIICINATCQQQWGCTSHATWHPMLMSYAHTVSKFQRQVILDCRWMSAYECVPTTKHQSWWVQWEMKEKMMKHFKSVKWIFSIRFFECRKLPTNVPLQ